jgi:hypothetical protein
MHPLNTSKLSFNFPISHPNSYYKRAFGLHWSNFLLYYMDNSGLWRHWTFARCYGYKTHASEVSVKLTGEPEIKAETYILGDCVNNCMWRDSVSGNDVWQVYYCSVCGAAVCCCRTSRCRICDTYRMEGWRRESNCVRLKVGVHFPDCTVS